MHRFKTAAPAAAAVLILLWGCRADSPRVCIDRQGREIVCVGVEVAKTPDQRRLGLMYRKSLPKGNGMLFVFDSPKVQAFTMKNTFIPLDMVFINRNGRIVGLSENTRPQSPGPYKADQPSLYVLEVNASFCKAHGIAVGDTVRFINL